MKSRIVAGNRPKAVVVAIVAIGSVCAGVYTAYEFRRSERGEEVLASRPADEPLSEHIGDANLAPAAAERAEAPPAGTSSPTRRADRPRDDQPVDEAARAANADPPPHLQPEHGGRGEGPITATGPATSRQGLNARRPVESLPDAEPGFGSASEQAASTPSAEAPAPAEPTEPAAPARVTTVSVPSGTILGMRVAGRIGSKLSKPGDSFQGVLTNALPYEDGSIPAGSAVHGTVIEASPSGRIKGRALISLELREIEFQGSRHSLRTDTVTIEAASTTARDAKRVGIGAGLGAIAGGLLGGKSGAAKGAAVGGASGGVGVLLTKGREVELDSENLIYFELRDELVLEIGGDRP